MRIQLKVRRVLLVVAVMALMIHGTHESSDCHVSPGAFKKNTSVKVNVGDNITLPCIPTFKFSKDDDSFEWLKGGEHITLINGKKDPIIHANYTHRINLIALIEELDKGRASLNLNNVKLSDNGNFCCCIHNGTLSCISLTLVVTSAETDMQMNNQAPENSTDSATKRPDWVMPVCVGVPLLVLFLLVVGGIAICKWKKKKERSNEGQGRQTNQNSDEDPEAVPLEVLTDNAQRANIRNVRQRRKCSVV